MDVLYLTTLCICLLVENSSQFQSVCLNSGVGKTTTQKRIPNISLLHIGLRIYIGGSTPRLPLTLDKGTLSNKSTRFKLNTSF